MRLVLDDFLAALSFYSRLPAPAPSGAPDFSRLAAAAPLAGAFLGALAALALLIANLLHLPPLLCASLAIAALALLTGALHEDGFADVADGFGGGRDRDAKLAIMRDSRLGSYGGLALTLATIARVGALAALFERNVFLAAFVLIFVGAASRVAGLAPLLMLVPARADGLAAAVSPPDRQSAGQGLAVAACFALPLWLAGAPLSQLLFAIAAAGLLVWGLARLAQRQIGGYTGDVLGAAQQAAEIALLICLSAA